MRKKAWRGMKDAISNLRVGLGRGKCEKVGLRQRVGGEKGLYNFKFEGGSGQREM